MSTPEHRQPNPQEEPYETGWERLSSLFSHEKEPDAERETVRIFTVRMRSPEEIIADILPVADEQGHTRIPPLEISCSESVWEVKSDVSKASSRQIILPGGKRLKNGEMESPAQAAIRNLATELHYFGVFPDAVIPIAERSYSFLHPDLDGKKQRLLIHETVVSAEVPPFLKPGYFDPRDKLKGGAFFPQATLARFLTEERDPESGGVLLDSLSDDQSRKRKRRVQTDGRETEIKQTILEANDMFEALVLGDVVRELVAKRTTGANPAVDALLHAVDPDSVGVSARDRTAFIHFIPNLLSRLERTYDGETAEDRRNAFSKDLLSALRRVYVSRSLPFIDHTGPQLPHLLTQVMLTSNGLTEADYTASGTSPEIRHILDTAASVVGVEPGVSGWYERIRDQLKDYVRLKNRVTEGRADSDERQTYKALLTAFKNEFSRFKPGLPDIDPASIERLAVMINQFAAYLESPIGQIADPAIRRQLFSNPQGAGTSQLDELFLRAFGVDQYRGTDIPLTERHAAWRKIILIMQLAAVEKMWNETISNATYPYRKAFDLMFPSETAREFVIDGVPYARYAMDRSAVTVHNPKAFSDIGLSADDLPVFVISEPRDKNLLSLLRKYLERGDLSADTLSDFFGRIIALDDGPVRDRIVQQLKLKRIRPRKETVEKLYNAWAKEVIDAITACYRDRMESWGYTYARDHYKSSGFLVGVAEGTHTYKGSAASLPSWIWVKYVHTATLPGLPASIQEELQFFPDIGQFRWKLADDERYETERLFVSNGPARYPTGLVLSGVQKGYNQVVTEIEKLKSARLNA